MPKNSQPEKPEPIVPIGMSDFVTILILGGVIGLIIWGLGLLFHTYIFEGYFCQEGAGRECENATSYAAVAATLLGSIAALAALIRLRVYRPLLVLIASILSTWGVVQMSWDLQWFTGILVAVVLYALAFGAFSWIARIREFWISVVVIILLVVAVRLAITS